MGLQIFKRVLSPFLKNNTTPLIPAWGIELDGIKQFLKGFHSAVQQWFYHPVLCCSKLFQTHPNLTQAGIPIRIVSGIYTLGFFDI